MNKLSSEVQDVDRCVRCNHERKCSDNLEGKCRYERVIEDIASSVCGCKCEFPSPSVPPCRHGRNANEYCFDCVRERHNEDDLDGCFDEQDSVSPKPKAPSHSPVVVSGDSSENADEPLPEFALADLDLWFRRVLGERLRYRSTTRSDSPVGEGYSYVEIPEWEMRQKLDLVREATSGVNALLANPITQDAGGLPSTTVPDPSQASSPKSESPSESESTLVTVATEALDEVLAFPHTADADTYLVARAQLAALKTHATVHQPDVQVVDEVSKEQDNAKS